VQNIKQTVRAIAVKL